MPLSANTGSRRSPTSWHGGHSARSLFVRSQVWDAMSVARCGVLPRRWTRTRLPGAGSHALAAVVVGLMVFSSCAGPEPEQSGGGETASASNSPVTPESSPNRSPATRRGLRIRPTAGDRRVWLVHPDGTEDHQIAMDAAQQQLLPDWSPDGGRLVFTTRGDD